MANANAAIVTEPVEYNDHGTVLEGFVTYDNNNDTSKPGILMVPDWMGITDATKAKAEQIANLGYAVFAADIYGKGVRPHNATEAGETSKKYFNDRMLLRSRIRAAYDKFIATKKVDPKEMVVMGYCFGGTTALELARSGAPLVGTVSFHGILANPNPQDAENIKGKVLVLHGAEDPMVPPKQVDDFKKEMKDANVEMTFIAYPGAVHAFTNQKAGNDKSTGIAYDEQADIASWEEFKSFLKQVFEKKK